jgi:hypothetical protein
MEPRHNLCFDGSKGYPPFKVERAASVMGTTIRSVLEMFLAAILSLAAMMSIALVVTIVVLLLIAVVMTLAVISIAGI